MKEPEQITVAPVLAAQYSSACGTDPNEISATMGKAFEVLHHFAGTHGLQFASPPRAIYTGYDPEGIEFTVAIPIAAAPAADTDESEVTVGEVPGGQALRFIHEGPYPKLMETYGQITEWMKAQGMLESEADWAKYMPMWEEYMNDPESTPAEELITNIYVPVG
jgi:effector-binding domain-containing protein